MTRQFEATVEAVTVTESTDEEVETLLDENMDIEEYKKAVEDAIESQIRPAFVESQLQSLNVTVEEIE